MANELDYNDIDYSSVQHLIGKKPVGEKAVVEKPSTGNLATDAPKAVARGIARLPDVVGSAIETAGSGYAKMADVALGNENAGQGGAIENAVVSGIGKARDYTTRPIADYVDESLPYSQGTQEAQNELMTDIAKIGDDKNLNFAQKTLKSLGAAATNPRGSLPSVAESIPQFVAGAAALKAAKVAEGLSGLGKASELTAKAETAANWGATKSVSLLNEAKIAAAAGDTAKAAKLTALAEKKALEGSEKAANLTNLANRARNVQDTAITGIGNAALEGEGAARGVRDDIMNMPVETLMQNPQFAQLASEVGEDEARRITSETAASNAYTPAAVLGATASALTGGGLEGALMRGFRDTAGKGVIKSVAVGGLKEMTEEGMQGASGQMAQNFAEQPYTGADLMSGVAEQVGMGAGMGLFSGGAGSAAGAAYNKAQQTKVKANELAEQAANTNGLSGAALTGQSAQLNADADAQLTEAQRLQDEVQPIDNIEPETQPVSPFKPLTQDIHDQVSNTLAFANEAIKNTKAGSDVKFKDKDATAIKTAADNLGIDLFNIDGTEKLPAQLVTEANTRLADYNVASIKPDVIDNAKNVINDIDFTTPLTPKESNSLRAVASDLGIQHDPVRPELTLPKIQKTIDLHTKLNAKQESTLSPTTTNTGTNGRIESDVQPNADAGITDKEQPTPTGNTDATKPATPAWIKARLNDDTIQSRDGSGTIGFNSKNKAINEQKANKFINDNGIADTHVAVNTRGTEYEIHSKKFAEANKARQESEIPDALKPSKDYHKGIRSLVNDLNPDGGKLVKGKDGFTRTPYTNGTFAPWFANGNFKVGENKSPETVARIKQAVDRHEGFLPKSTDKRQIEKDHLILQKLSDILIEEQRANSFEQEDTRSDDIKTAFERNSGKKITDATESDLNEMDKWAKEAVENEADNADEAQAVINEINEYRANARNETTDTTQFETQRTGEDTADIASNGVQAKETVTNDDADKQVNKAQDDQSTNETKKTTSEEVDEATARDSKPVEETTETEDNVLPTAKSSGNANTQSSEPAAKSEQNAVSSDNVEQALPDDITTFVNKTRDGKWTAKEFNAELTKFLTDHQINERIQFEKMDVSPEQTAAAVFQELGFDAQKVRAVEALSEALANNAESRIKNENLIKASVIELKTMLDDGEITQEQFNELTKNTLKTTNVRSKKADAALSALRQEAKAKGLGDFTKKTDSNYSVHVQPNPSTAKSLAEQAKNEVSDLSATQLGNKIAEAKKQLSLLGKAFEQLKRIFHLLFSSNKAIANENTFTPVQWVSKDGKTVFTVQKVPKSFEFFDSKKDSPEAQAIQAKMDKIIADDERRQRLEFNLDGTKGESFVFDDSQLGNNPILKTLNSIVKAANKRVPLKGLDDISQTNIQGFIEANAVRIGVLNIAIDRANLALKEKPEAKVTGKAATGVIQLLLGNKTTAKSSQYRGVNLSLIKDNGKTFITVGQSRYLPDIEIDIGRKSPLKSVLDKIDKQIDTLMNADLNAEIASMQEAISDLEQTNDELIRILRDQKGFEQYKIGQAKKAQEARWINQQQSKPQETKAEPNTKSDVKPSKPFTKKQIIDIINNPQESEISSQSSRASNLYTEIKVGDDFVLHAQIFAGKDYYSTHIGYFPLKDDAREFAKENNLDTWYEGESEDNYFADFDTVEDVAEFLVKQNNLGQEEKELDTVRTNYDYNLEQALKSLEQKGDTVNHYRDDGYAENVPRIAVEHLIAQMDFNHAEKNGQSYPRELRDLLNKIERLEGELKALGWSDARIHGNGENVTEERYQHLINEGLRGGIKTRKKPTKNTKPSKSTPANKPMAQADSTANKSDADKPLSEMDELKSQMGQAIGEAISLLGGKMNMSEEEETKLVPIMAKIFRIAAKMGYVKFKDTASYVYGQIRELADKETADKFTLEHLLGGYASAGGKDFIGMSEVKSLDDLLSEPKTEQSNPVEIDSIKNDTKQAKKSRKPRAKLPKEQVQHAENVLGESNLSGDLFAFAEDVIMPVTNSGMVSLEALHETPAEELTDSEAETYFDNLAADIIIQAEKEGIPDVDTEEETRIIEALAEIVPAETIAEARSEARKPTHTINDDGEIVPVIRNGKVWETVDGKTEYDDSFEVTPIQSENTITLGDEILSLETVFERLKSKSESTKMRDLLKGHKDEARIMAINKGVGTNANQKHAPILQALIDLGRYSKENPRGFSMDC